MALLTNINGKFSVSDAGAVRFNDAFTFPTVDGTANYVLKTNGSGQLAWAPDANTGTVTGSGTANTMPVWTSASALGNSIITQPSSANVRVSGSSVYFSVTDTSVAARNIDIGHWVAGQTNIESVGGILSIGTQSNHDIVFETNGSTKATILANGNVGIGTNSPSSKLQVSGDAYVTEEFGQGVAIANKVTTYGAEFRSSGASAQVFFGRSGNDIGSGAIGADSSYVFRVWKPTDFSQPFVIEQGGNVGIGTTTPQRPLHVNGTEGVARFTSTASGNNGFEVGIGTSSQAFLWLAENSHMEFATNNVERMRIDSSGLTTIKRTGITGVAKADMTLQIGYEGNNGQNNLIGFGYNAQTNIPAYIGYTTTSGSGSTKGDLVFGTRDVTTDSAPSERMRIDSSGRIMINQSSNITGQILQVNGFIDITKSTSNAIRFFDNTTFRGGLGLDSWATGGSASNMTMFCEGEFGIVTGGGNTRKLVMDTSGKVGIGVTDPDAKLEIKGTGASTGLTFKTTDSSDNEIFYIKDGGVVGVRYYPFKIGVPSGTANVANTRLQVATTAGDFVVLNDGKTGIGIATPNSKLQVTGTVNTLLAHFGGQNNTNGHWNGISLGYAEDANAAYRKIGIAAKALGDGAARQELHFLVNSNADSNSAGIGDTKRMIDKLGHVGIGLTDPNSYYGDQLVIAAPDENGITITGTGTGQKQYLCFADGSTGDQAYTGYIAYDHNNDSMSFANNGGNGRLTINSDGSIYAPGLIESGGSLAAGDGVAGAPGFKFRSDPHTGMYRIGNDTIGMTTGGSLALTIASNGNCTAAGDVVAYSDERLKTNIKTLDGSKVYGMRGVSFTKDDKEGSGVIAQELEKIAPELVNSDSEYKAVAYGNITGYLIEAIKELKAEIEELKSNKCNCNK